MPDTRPLEERFDITYVRRSQWPSPATRWLAWIVALGGGGLLAMLSVRGDHRLFSSGPLSVVHASFGDDCAQCHQPALDGSSNYFLPVSDNACLRCHAAAEHQPNQSQFSAGSEVLIPGHDQPLRMAARCAECHVEHRGPDADLSMVPDRLCVECHANLSLKGIRPGAMLSEPEPDQPAEVQP